MVLFGPKRKKNCCNKWQHMPNLLMVGVVRAETEEELLQQVAAHAKSAHGKEPHIDY
jgi:hypothetical protein